MLTHMLSVCRNDDEAYRFLSKLNFKSENILILRMNIDILYIFIGSMNNTFYVKTASQSLRKIRHVNDLSL